MKRISVILLALVLVTAVLFSAKNIIAKSLLQAGVRSFTGSKLAAEQVNVDLFASKAYIKGLTLFNPEGFPQEIMAVIPEIYINYDLGTCFSGKVHLKEMRLYLEKLAVMRNQDGKLNIQVVNEAARKKVSQIKAVASNEKSVKTQDADRPEMAIDILTVKLGSVSYRDSANSNLGLSASFNLDSEQRYENIKSKQQLLDAILNQATKGAFGGFAFQGSYSKKDDFKKMGDDFAKQFKDIGKSFKGMFSTKEAN